MGVLSAQRDDPVDLTERADDEEHQIDEQKASNENTMDAAATAAKGLACLTPNIFWAQDPDSVYFVGRQ